MIRPSECQHWQTDRAACAAQERRSYTTPGDMILASGRGDVEHCIDNASKAGRTWPSKRTFSWHKREEQLPLLVPQVACIPQVVPPILRAGDFSPRHMWLRRVSQTNGITTCWNHPTLFQLSGDRINPSGGDIENPATLRIREAR